MLFVKKRGQLLLFSALLLPLIAFSQNDIIHYQNTQTKKEKAPVKTQDLPLLPFFKKTEIPLATKLVEINGMVMNASTTRGGYDFYLYFTRHWAEPNNVPSYNITINEFPGRGRNIRVGIMVNEKQVFTRNIQPSADGLESLAKALADYIHGYITSGKHVASERSAPEYLDGDSY
jgi:hypothetical protein